MKISMSKTKFTTIAFLLFAIIALPMMSLSSVSAHTPAWTVPRYAFVTVAPDPVGPGQQVAIVIWGDIPPPSAAGRTGDRWTGYTVDVTKPDGTVVHVLQNGASDPVGSSYALYTPDVVGTYSVTFSFPAQVAQLAGYTGFNGTASPYVGDNYLGASATTTFTVQSTTVQYFQEAQLPVSYWTRPINENNQGWSQIASAWLSQQGFGETLNKFNPYGWAPSTAHVSMLYPLSMGGIVGGDNAVSNSMSFYSGTQYNLKFTNPIIVYGMVIFSLPASPANSGNGIAAVDLRTGETVWTRTDINSVTFGQLYDGETPNQHGTSGMYLWYSGSVPVGSRLNNPGTDAVNLIKGPFGPSDAFTAQQSSGTATTLTASASAQCAIDIFTGKNVFNETGLTGSRAAGPQGEELYYAIGRASGNPNAPFTYVTQMNNTKLPGIEANAGITAWGPGISNYNMSTSYDWNVTLDQALPVTYSSIGSLGGFSGSAALNTTTGIYTANPSIVTVIPGNFILGQSSGLQTIPGTSFGVFGTQDPYTIWAINLNATRGPIGHVLFQTQYPAPSGNKTVQIGPVDGQNNVFTIYFRETLQWSGYNALTGAFMWGPTAPQNSWNYYSGTTGLTNPIGLGYGHLYTAGYSGILYAINTKTGNVDFTYGNSLTDPNNSTRTPETVYGEYPTQVAAIANNKVYLVEEEHSLNAPAYHGAMTRCVDASSGKLLWQIYGISSWQGQAVADGYYTWLNYNDGMIYAMGPGPSATTIAAPNVAVPLGTGIEITGTVTDQTPQAQLKGTPAVSDADQGKQMEYLIQHSIDAPTNIAGVPVTIFATDSAGVTIQIAQVTSTGTGGVYHYLWTPKATGEYVITASFQGSQAYGPSSAQTAIGVTAAVTPVVTSTPTPTATASPTPSAIVTPTPTTPQGPGGIPSSTVYAIAAAVVIIVIVAVAAVALRKRK